MDIDSERKYLTSETDGSDEVNSCLNAEEKSEGDSMIPFVKSKAIVLLDRLSSRLLQSASLPDPAGQGTISIPKESATSPATRVVERLLNLDSLERQGESLSIQINHCYFSIGESYRLFAEVGETRKNSMPKQLADLSRAYRAC